MHFWGSADGAGGRAGGCGKGVFGKNQAPRKSRARRAPCLWQGAADLKARAPLPPAPSVILEDWIPFLVGLEPKNCSQRVFGGVFEFLQALVALFFDLGDSF